MSGIDNYSSCSSSSSNSDDRKHRDEFKSRDKNDMEKEGMQGGRKIRGKNKGRKRRTLTSESSDSEDDPEDVQFEMEELKGISLKKLCRINKIITRELKTKGQKRHRSRSKERRSNKRNTEKNCEKTGTKRRRDDDKQERQSRKGDHDRDDVTRRDDDKQERQSRKRDYDRDDDNDNDNDNVTRRDDDKQKRQSRKRDHDRDDDNITRRDKYSLRGRFCKRSDMCEYLNCIFRHPGQIPLKISPDRVKTWSTDYSNRSWKRQTDHKFSKNMKEYIPVSTPRDNNTLKTTQKTNTADDIKKTEKEKTNIPKTTQKTNTADSSVKRLLLPHCQLPVTKKNQFFLFLMTHTVIIGH